MSALILTSDSLIGSPASGNIEYSGQFYGTDTNNSRAQFKRYAQDTVKNSTSVTSIDFTGIPAWAKRVTIMFNGVSTTGTSPVIVQLGYSGGFTGATYNSSGSGATTGVSSVTTTVGLYAIGTPAGGGSGAAYAMNGMMNLTNMTGNIWASMAIVAQNSVAHTNWAAGIATAGGTLSQVRITTVGGTETFDAGSINILYEG
jgi:hypothetical protein